MMTFVTMANLSISKFIWKLSILSWNRDHQYFHLLIILPSLILNNFQVQNMSAPKHVGAGLKASDDQVKYRSRDIFSKS